MSDDDNVEYGLVLSFCGPHQTEAETHAFVHGVEFGQIWHRMSSGDEAEIDTVTHTANRVVIERAAASKGWDVEIKSSDTEGWDFTKLVKVRAEKPNPHGFRVVR